MRLVIRREIERERGIKIEKEREKKRERKIRGVVFIIKTCQFIISKL